MTNRHADSPSPASKMAPEKILREYPPVGRYRVRVVEGRRGHALDIREYVTGETFEGFTRRGIRLSDKAQAKLLRDALDEFLRG